MHHPQDRPERHEWVGVFFDQEIGFLVAFLFLVVRPGAPSSVLAPSRDARSS